MKKVITIEDGVKFLQEYDFGNAIESIDICTLCENKYPTCSATAECKTKLIAAWLMQEV